VSDSKERLWLQNRFQEGRVQHRFSSEERRTLLRDLTAAEGLERYLATKYPAQKRFSLEGGDALIPLLDDLIQQGGQRGIEEIVIGMAHRGRLNVLVNVVGKSPHQPERIDVGEQMTAVRVHLHEARDRSLLRRDVVAGRGRADAPACCRRRTRRTFGERLANRPVSRVVGAA
jgi:hypothetical protein